MVKYLVEQRETIIRTKNKTNEEEAEKSATIKK